MNAPKPKEEIAGRWEMLVSDDEYDWLERLKIPGGWLYRSTQKREFETGAVALSESMVFVPDEGAQ